jgi:tryptophan synthase alpha chain
MTANARGARYTALFERLREAGEGAFIPFAMLGDPDSARSLTLVRSLVRAGADALEVGLPFSDPVADGPVIQEAATRALAAGVRRSDCWSILRETRREFPDTPIGLLVYANLVCHRDPAEFYGVAAEAGVDSVLVADLPVLESGPVARAARASGIAPVYIAPPNADDERLRAIAAASEGYTYVTSREGVTGADARLKKDQSGLIARLKQLGAISGSAVVRLAAEGGDVPEFVRAMKGATRGNSSLS